VAVAAESVSIKNPGQENLERFAATSKWKYWERWTNNMFIVLSRKILKVILSFLLIEAKHMLILRILWTHILQLSQEKKLLITL
jgi:hypothetical protein